jgi:hypothetical protein
MIAVKRRNIGKPRSIWVNGDEDVPSDDPIVETPRDSSSGLLTGALKSLAIMLTHRFERSCDAGYSS